jgi:hypothetical protein
MMHTEVMQSREALARQSLRCQSLRWDAGYCTITGLALGATMAPLSEAIDVAAAWIVVAGLLTVAWGIAIRWMAHHDAWFRWTVAVLLANVGAAAGLLGATLAAGLTPGIQGLFWIVAAQVFGFAALQAHALWSPFVR